MSDLAEAMSPSSARVQPKLPRNSHLVGTDAKLSGTPTASSSGKQRTPEAMGAGSSQASSAVSFVEGPLATSNDMVEAPAHRGAPAMNVSSSDGNQAATEVAVTRESSMTKREHEGDEAANETARAAQDRARKEKEKAEEEANKVARNNRAELDKVKAMTMHEMIEEVHVGTNKKKMLFLTHEQAELLSTTTSSLDKMLEAFEVGKPQLVINLLESGGFGDWTRQRSASEWKKVNERWAPGVQYNAPPFMSQEEERSAEYGIDLFMSDVLIPLAAQTHAVVICCAIPSLCILSASFTRMFQAVKAKWSGKPPFTVLSTTADMLALYSSKKYPDKVPPDADWGGPGVTVKDCPLKERYKGTVWREIMLKSSAWSDWHAEIATGLHKITENPLKFDLDNNADTFIIVNDGGRGTFAKLIKNLTRHLAANLPSIAIKTGCSAKRHLGDKYPSTLEVAADSATSGTPTLFLDVRPVPDEVYNGIGSREQLIKRAMAFVEKQNDLMFRGTGPDEQKLTETFDTCTIAFFHDVLVGDGDPSTEELTGGKAADEYEAPLHRAIAAKLRQKRKMMSKQKETSQLISGGPPTTPKGITPSFGKVLSFGSTQSFRSPSRKFKDTEMATQEASSPSPRSRFDAQAVAMESGTLVGSRVRTMASSMLGMEDEDEDEYQEKWSDEPATPQQVVAASDWITENFFRNGWNLLSDKARQRPDGSEGTFDVEGRNMYRAPMLAMSVACRTLLASPNFYHVNLTQHATAKRLVAQLVQLDRLPRENSLEGLQLLRSAWRDYDISMLLAGRYKRVCKVAYMVQLLLGWAAISLAAFADLPACQSQSLLTLCTINIQGNMLLQVIFVISVTMTLVIAFDSIMQSHARWRHLRIGAGALESVVWKYRTRTGAFEIDETGSNNDSRAPEIALLQAIKSTRQVMLASANLATTELGKKYPLSVYKHFQDRGEPKAMSRAQLPADADSRHTAEEVKDDFQSPTQPTKYISLRVEPAMAFYQKRIPTYSRRAAILKLLVVMFAVGASVLARYNQTIMVVFVTAAGAAITSWSEFSDTQRKTERYTRCVHALRDLLDWWRCLNEVEKASKPNINRLVAATESIINEEQTAWTSTPQGDSKESDDADEENEDKDRHRRRR